MMSLRVIDDDVNISLVISVLLLLLLLLDADCVVLPLAVLLVLSVLCGRCTVGLVERLTAADDDDDDDDDDVRCGSTGTLPRFCLMTCRYLLPSATAPSWRSFEASTNGGLAGRCVLLTLMTGDDDDDAVMWDDVVKLSLTRDNIGESTKPLSTVPFPTLTSSTVSLVLTVPINALLCLSAGPLVSVCK